MTSQYVSNTEGGYEVGDIVAGCTHWGCTRPSYYKIKERKGRTQFVLEKLKIAYDSEYLTNSPCYLAVPVGYYAGGGSWYTFNDNRPNETMVARVIKFEMDYMDKPDYNLKLVGDKYGPLLSKWNGEPICGNCD